MGYRIVTSTQAELDIDEAIEYYKKIRLELVREFLAEVNAAREYIQNNPRKFQIRYHDVRIAFLKRFPYGIHFLIEDKKIFILSVFHTSKDSDKWFI